MGRKLRELFLLLALCAVALSEPIKSKKDQDNYLDQYDDYDSTDDQEEVLFNEDKPCPRDCICTVSQGCRIAKCNRLEVGVQKFGDDITDLVIENIDPRFPISLDDFIFKKLGLHRVTTIKIVNSSISYVGPNAFQGLPELYAVNLSNNKLKSLDPETFANNKKLLLLTLAENPLMFPAEYSGEYFLNASSVQELDISYCNIRYIASSAFDNMPGLMYLNVAGNSLSKIHPDVFNKQLDLEELDLSDNNITHLPEDLFSKNTELVTLHIQRNPIQTVFNLSIPDLLTLNAGQTNITMIGPSMFNGMKYIGNLNLSGNNIEMIHNQAFHKLVELNYIDLSYNKLNMMSNQLIRENIELNIFKISNNPNLKHLPKDGFECAAEQFNIYYFDASNCGLEEIYDNTLSTFTALSLINLAGNQIKEVSSKVFSHCPKLVEINLANNFLTVLDSKMFENNKELGKLNLKGNPIKVLPHGLFSHTPALTWLDVSYSQLTTLIEDEKNSTGLTNLSFLNISNCLITEIKQNEIEHMNKLRTLDISNNPLACSHEFENLMSWLNKRNVSPSANQGMVANLARSTKDDEVTYSWDFLTKKTCGSAPHPVQPLPPSEELPEEEIWDTVGRDVEGFKNTLDDAKIADDKADTKLDDVDNNYADKDDADDAYDEDEDDDDANEDYDDDDVELKVKLEDKPPKKIPENTPISDNQYDTMKLNVQILSKEVFLDPQDAEQTIDLRKLQEPNYLIYCSLAVVILLGLAIFICLLRFAFRARNNSGRMQYNSAIISAMNHHSRTKKDCGLVYQQLSEDLTGPATPKLSRYQPLQSVAVNATTTSYESSPFHHNKIIPEAV